MMKTINLGRKFILILLGIAIGLIFLLYILLKDEKEKNKALTIYNEVIYSENCYLKWRITTVVDSFYATYPRNDTNDMIHYEDSITEQ